MGEKSNLRKTFTFKYNPTKLLNNNVRNNFYIYLQTNISKVKTKPKKKNV